MITGARKYSTDINILNSLKTAEQAHNPTKEGRKGVMTQLYESF